VSEPVPKNWNLELPCRSSDWRRHGSRKIRLRLSTDVLGGEGGERLGFPMGGNVDTFLMRRSAPTGLQQGHAARVRGRGLSGAAQSRRQSRRLGRRLPHREADRIKVFEDNRDRWGREWIMLANPACGSFEFAAFGHDYKKSPDEQRKAKREALQSWSGP
jgi:hypothetical protein